MVLGCISVLAVDVFLLCWTFFCWANFFLPLLSYVYDIFARVSILTVSTVFIIIIIRVS